MTWPIVSLLPTRHWAQQPNRSEHSRGQTTSSAEACHGSSEHSDHTGKSSAPSTNHAQGYRANPHGKGEGCPHLPQAGDSHG